MTRSKRAPAAVLLAAAVLLLSAAAPPPAHASFPGANGLIAFTDRTGAGDIDIFVVNPNGTGRRDITNTPGVDDLYPAFSADGSKIAFVRRVATGQGVKDLWVMNADGSSAVNITNGSFTDIDSPAWAPDGNTIAVVGTADGSYGLWTVNAGDGSRVLLATSRWAGSPDWSPDGNRIAFSAWSYPEDTPWATLAMSVYAVTPGSGDPVLIAAGRLGDSGAGEPAVIAASSPSWSPDGTRIAFNRNDYDVAADEWPTQIQTVLPDGTGSVPVGVGWEPAWSPDGDLIAYTGKSGTGLWTMSSDGSNPVQITATGTDANWGVGGFHYDFGGFYAPVDMGKRNVAKAGSAVPIKFSLGGDQGLGIMATGYPKAVAVTCDTGEALDAIETYAAGGSGLTYDAATGRYTYVWKTQKAWRGCYEFRMVLIDGSLHVADFQFK